MGNGTIEQVLQLTIQYYQQARLGDAEKLCQEILASDPRRVEALNIAGLLAIARGEHASAEHYFRQALAIAPESEYSWNNLGIALYNQNQFAQAAESSQKALSYNPDNPSALNNLGDSLNHLGRYEEALAYCQRAVSLVPESVEARVTLGVTYYSMGRIEEALEEYRRAVELDPADAQTRTYFAATLLLLGRFREGWEAYEHRAKESRHGMSAEQLARPEWTGESIEGKTLLVHAEQGLGDNIQFARYLPEIARRGGKVIYVCRPELRRVLATLENVQVVARGDAIPPFDLQSWILSLPHLLGTTMENIPHAMPYLKADENATQAWRRRLPHGFKAGVVWAGNPRHANDLRRSIPFAQLAPLLDVPGVTFVSVQKGPAARQAENRSAGARWVDAAPELADLADTAAMLANMDMVISVDTAVAHLAGALGKTVWTLLPHVPDFRWLLKRHDSPWYPTMRLFRQPQPEQWDPVIADVAARLREKVRTSEDGT